MVLEDGWAVDSNRGRLGADVCTVCAGYGTCRHRDSLALGTSDDRRGGREGECREGVRGQLVSMYGGGGGG